MSDRFESKAVRKYLDRYAESEARGVLPPGEYRHVVVVPAYGEEELLGAALASIPPDHALVVLVVNARESSDAGTHAANAAVRRRFPEGRLHELAPGLRVWMIDRAQPGAFLPEKEGVGLARKIGCDLALAMIVRGRVADRYIHVTDADAIVPTDYFGRADASDITAPIPAAFLFPFEHEAAGDEDATLAIKLYECWLRYHVLGLAAVGSPYAFHSIGSTMAIDAVAYAEVRGFPRRMAGEDFYVLNKLAKVGEIISLRGAPIRLSGRVSDRVPFGTGRAMTELLSGDLVSSATYSLPDPQVYRLVGGWIAFLDAVAREPLLGIEKNARDWITGHLPDSSALTFALEATGSFSLIEQAIEEPVDEENRRRRLHTAFDGFRTLKLLHALRDIAYPAMAFFDALSRAEWLVSENLARPTRSRTSCEKFHKRGEEVEAVEEVRLGLIQLEKRTTSTRGVTLPRRP